MQSLYIVWISRKEWTEKFSNDLDLWKNAYMFRVDTLRSLMLKIIKQCSFEYLVLFGITMKLKKMGSKFSSIQTSS